MGGQTSLSKLQVKNDVSCFIVAANPHLRGPRRSSSTLRAKNEKGAAPRAENGETPAAECFETAHRCTTRATIRAAAFGQMHISPVRRGGGIPT